MPEATEFKPKLIKKFSYSDEIVEVLEIDFTGFGTSGGRKGRKSEEVTEEDRERNIKRVKRNVRRLAFSNDLGQVHLVLTYKENMQDADKSDADFKKYMFELHKEYPYLKYLATREIQKHRQEKYGVAVIHYHVLLNQRINIKKAQNLWKHGYITLVQHKNKLKAVMYVLKYISKEVGETVLKTKNGHTKKAYLSSQGLKKELDQCTTSYLINNPDAYVEYNDGMNFLITNLTEGWDIPFEIPVKGRDGEEKMLQGRSILRCAANNY